MGEISSTRYPQSGGVFTTTEWSMVLSAAEDASDQANEALERLCRAYWYPLYTLVRRRGYDAHSAQDLTQAFFERMLEKSFLRSVDRNKGKFRSFLIAALEHFLAKEWRRAHAQKRGGYARFMSLDDDTAEQQYLEISASTLTPEQLFDQQWAISLLDVVLKRLSEEFAEDGKANAFAEMKIFLTGEKGLLSYAELAPRLDTSEAALKMAVSRMRQRYGELLRAEISRTVAGPEEVEEELRSLFASLSL